jgi:branched-chain amino acid transport system substrate-binding protein
VRLVELDSAAAGGQAGAPPAGQPWDPAAVEANARRAVDDPTAIAYVGELDLGASAVSVPVTAGIGLLQVSPGDGLTTLTRGDAAQPEETPERYYHGGRRNFVRLVPTDAQQAAAIVAWARERGARRLAIVRDDQLFGRELAAEASAAAAREHVTVTAIEEARHGLTDYSGLARDVAARSPNAVLYTGTGGPDGARLLGALGAALPGASLYGSSALAAAPEGGGPATYVVKPAAPPSSYGARARGILRRLQLRTGAPVATEALYGYAAMQVVLDAIDEAGRRAGDRAAVVRAALRSPAPSSVLGEHPVDARGDAAAARLAAYRRAGGRLTFIGIRAAPAPPAPTPP